MLIRSPKSEFYGILKSKAESILLLVARDVDALCASLLLQHALRVDHKQFSVVSVGCMTDVAHNVRSFAETTNHMVLINCGATHDVLLDAFPLDENDEQNIPPALRLYVVDSRRPIHLDNLYDAENSDRVHILCAADEDLTAIPQQSDVVYEVDSDSEDYDPLHHERWKKRLDKILWRYYQFTYHESPASLMMLRLVHELSLAAAEQCWIAIVGVTSTYLFGRRDKAAYANDCAGDLRQLMRRATKDVNTRDSLDIKFERDIWMPCYRHWSLYESALHCVTLFSRFQLWSQQGPARLLKFFAHIGLPINECKQKYSAMKTELRKELIENYTACAGDWKVDDVLVDTFVCKWSYTNCLSAFEHAAALHALLHIHINNQPTSDQHKFNTAAEALTNRKSTAERVYQGISLYEHFVSVVAKEVSAALLHSYAMPCNSYVHLQLHCQGADAQVLSQPLAVVAFGRFFIRAFMNTARGKKRYRGWPLVVSVQAVAPIGHHVFAAIPPIEAETQMQCRNLMTRAFENAATIARVNIEPLSFEGTVIRMRSEDRTRFLDCLMSCVGREETMASDDGMLAPPAKAFDGDTPSSIEMTDSLSFPA